MELDELEVEEELNDELELEDDELDELVELLELYLQYVVAAVPCSN